MWHHKKCTKGHNHVNIVNNPQTAYVEGTNELDIDAPRRGRRRCANLILDRACQIFNPRMTTSIQSSTNIRLSWQNAASWSSRALQLLSRPTSLPQTQLFTSCQEVLPRSDRLSFWAYSGYR